MGQIEVLQKCTYSTFEFIIYLNAFIRYYLGSVEHSYHPFWQIFAFPYTLSAVANGLHVFCFKSNGLKSSTQEYNVRFKA